jgi:protein-disulfide isomerase
MLAGIPQNGTTLGKPGAKLTLIEFGDLQCSGCAWFSANVTPELIQNYVRTGKLRIEFEGETIIDHAHHDSARLLRMALAAAEQRKFWNFAEIVYANQGAEDSGYATDSYLKAVAAAVPGLNTAKAFSAAQTKAFESTIAKSKARFYALGANGTPLFLLGRSGGKTTEKITGKYVPSYRIMSAKIDALLGR